MHSPADLLRSFGALAFVYVFAACQPTPPGLGSVEPADIGGSADVVGSADAIDASSPAPHYPVDDTPPEVVLEEPAADLTVQDAALQLRGVASDDFGLAALTVTVGLNAERTVALPGPDGRFTLQVELGVGAQPVVVRAYDIGGNSGYAKVTVTRTVVGDTEPPEITILEPEDGFEVATAGVEVVGTTQDDGGVESVTVSVNGGPATIAQSDDNFATWRYEAQLAGAAPGEDVVITATATDGEGRTAQATVTGTTSFVGDLTPPEVAITSPDDGFATNEDTLEVTGTASDDSGIASVDIRVNDGPYQAVSSSDDFATWNATVKLQMGENVLKVRAIDSSGIPANAGITVHNTSGSEWTAPVTITLTWEEPAYGESVLTLDKAGLEEMMPPGVAEQLVMMELDVGPMIASALDAIIWACGSDWWVGDVTWNCPASWGPGEINVYRLVTMTPANVNVAGTSIEGTEELAGLLSDLGIGASFNEILALALGIGLYDNVVASWAVADAMQEDVVATHPNVLPGGVLPVTMKDALTDMQTLGPRFDAMGAHPGFIDSVNGQTYSQVLTDQFEMMMVAVSNLHWHDGVALDVGKSYVALLADVTGPSYDDVLEFDFLSPDKFQVSGIAANPTVDMVFKMTEHDGWVSIGTSRYPLPWGNGAAWDLDPWLLEYVFTDASYRYYWDHRAGCNLCTGSGSGALLWELIGIDYAEIVVGRSGYDKDVWLFGQDGDPEHFSVIDPNPAGWLRLWTLWGLGDPPPDQYVWDLILEVAEQRLLDGGVAQGNGDVAFALEDIDVGLTGEQIKDAVRPTMESQKSKLSELLLGDYNETAEQLDFYLARGDEGELYLFFVDPSDPVPSGTATHAKPGFFADLELTDKVSTTSAGSSGDSVHEKLAITDAEQLVYCQDAEGETYRLTVGAGQGTSVPVSFRRYLGGAP